MTSVKATYRLVLICSNRLFDYSNQMLINGRIINYSVHNWSSNTCIMLGLTNSHVLLTWSLNSHNSLTV